MLALRLLWRSWRSGEVKILTSALILAVTIVTTIAVFTGRLEQALVEQGQTFLGANRVIQSSSPIPLKWQAEADRLGVRTAQTVQFSSMIFAADDSRLAAVKAVSAHYPLLGELTVSQVPFAQTQSQIQVATSTPAKGEVWVDSRLLALLDIAIGDELYVGEALLRVSQLVVDEPDRGSGLGQMGARVMMSVEDLAATEVIQPGSRIRYRWLLAGDDAQLGQLLDGIKDEMTVHHRLIDIKSGQQGLSKALQTARKFLLLASVIGVLLAGVAIAIAARRYASRQVDQIALLKSLGVGRWRITGLYAAQFLTLGVITSAVGLLLGAVLQHGVAASVEPLLPVALKSSHWSFYLPGLFTGVVTLLGFVVPPMWHLPKIPPIKILRREMVVSSIQFYWQGGIGLLAMIMLVIIFSGDLWLAGSVTLAMLSLIVLAALLAGLLLRASESIGHKLGSVWRLALVNLKRAQQQSVIQIVVFSLAIMLLLALIGLRTSLLSDWQQQLPEGAPNHFLLNIAPDETEAIQSLLANRHLEPQPMYPMIRGRLININGDKPSEALMSDVEALNRELNLSWSDSLGADNRIVAGQWWDHWKSAADVGVSVESELAERMGLKLGDSVQFSIGGLLLQAEVASFRSLKWDSMNPNFYFLLSPGALDSFYPSYLTSVHIPADQKLIINDLLREFPTVVVIEMDRVIAQIQSIMKQVSSGIEWMLWVVLLSGFLVMSAAINASKDERMHEAALLRAMGSSRKRLLSSLWAEFTLLGFLSGLLAAAGAEVMLLSVQTWVLDLPRQWHPELWGFGVFASTLGIGIAGVVSCRHLVTTPPGAMLRQYA